jgi:hypothetical protein
MTCPLLRICEDDASDSIGEGAADIDAAAVKVDVADTWSEARLNDRVTGHTSPGDPYRRCGRRLTVWPGCNVDACIIHLGGVVSRLAVVNPSSSEAGIQED